MKEWVATGVAAEMVRKAKELTKEGVIVEAPVEARQAVAAASSKEDSSSKKSSSRSPSGRVWKPGASSASAGPVATTAYERNW
eukprot:5972603-Karenia_brevis.AAC.1